MSNELAVRNLEYRKQVHQLLLKEVPFLALVIALVVFGLMWLIVTYTGGQKLGPGMIDWRVGAAILWAALMVPPIKLMWPEKPSAESIELDHVLHQIGERLH